MKGICIVAMTIMPLLNLSALAGEELQFKVKDVSTQTVLLLKGESLVQTIGPDMGTMYGKVYGYMETKKIIPTGPPIAVYYSEPGPEWKIGVAVSVSGETVGQGDIESTTLPGGKMISVIHNGPYEKLGESWNALSDWMKESKYYPAGPGREIYLVGPPQETDPAKFQTELLWPVN